MATETGYVSRYLTHFVGRGKSRNEQYELLKRILMGHWLTHPPHVEQPSLGLTIHKDRVFSDNDMFIPDMLCFCDIPEAQLGIHTRKYSQFGIAFDKAYLIATFSARRGSSGRTACRGQP